jgi:DNA polymerase-3 subunit beta
MKVEISRQDLMNLLGKTQNIVERRNNMPILLNVLLDADQDQLRVFATDLEISLTDSAKAHVKVSGRLAVNARNFFEIIKKLEDGKVALTRAENNWLEIDQGKYHSKIVGISPDEFPIFPTFAKKNPLKVSSEILREMIDKTIYSIATDETRYHLNGVFFERKEDESCSMVATDGHRLSMVNRQVPMDPSFLIGAGVIIPRKALHEIRKLLDTLEGEFEIAIEGSQLIFKNGATVLLVRLIEGKYPNYNQFIPAKLKQKAMINREAFLNSIRRVALLANQKSKAITLTFSDGKMEISSNNPDLGDAKEELDVEFKGHNIKVGFNAKYIEEVLTAITDEQVDFEINDQLSPGLMRPHNDPSYTCVVMPMRI